MKVLVVDDQIEVRDGAEVLVTALGHAVTTAKDVRSAIELSMEDRPDLALVDIQMPEINGYEAAKLLRAEFGRAIWICALTGSPVDMPTAALCGFDGVLAKPIGTDMLQACFAEVARTLGITV